MPSIITSSNGKASMASIKEIFESEAKVIIAMGRTHKRRGLCVWFV